MISIYFRIGGLAVRHTSLVAVPCTRARLLRFTLSRAAMLNLALSPISSHAIGWHCDACHTRCIARSTLFRTSLSLVVPYSTFKSVFKSSAAVRRVEACSKASNGLDRRRQSSTIHACCIIHLRDSLAPSSRHEQDARCPGIPEVCFQSSPVCEKRARTSATTLRATINSPMHLSAAAMNHRLGQDMLNDNCY